MKKWLLITMVVVLLTGSVLAATPFERWSRGIEEVITNTDRLYGNRMRMAANEHSVPVEYLWAVVVVESNGDINSVSSTGVKGLTMLTSDVVNLIRQETGVVIDPLHAYESLWGAAWYLNYMVEKYGFSMDEATAAFYYGPTGLRRRLSGKKLDELYHYRKINHVLDIIRSQ